jgi:hypothetical protein
MLRVHGAPGAVLKGKDVRHILRGLLAIGGRRFEKPHDSRVAVDLEGHPGDVGDGH